MIQPANVLVLYNSNNSDSYAFAKAYQKMHNLNSWQLFPLNCSNNEILSSYSQFQTEIENDLYELIFNLYRDLSEDLYRNLSEENYRDLEEADKYRELIESDYRAMSDSQYSLLYEDNADLDVRAILVGYGVPGGFIDGGDIISTTSRLARLGKVYTKKTANPLFSRSSFHDYDDSDAAKALVVSRIDAPTLQIALNLLTNIQKVTRNGIANGSFFFDKYAVVEDSNETLYQNELTDFENRLLGALNVPVQKTSFWDVNTDVPVFRLKNDSFMWAWKADRAGYSFFQNNNTARVFLYNADKSGALSLRDSTNQRFPMLALASGYASTAGSLSDPTPAGFLRPRPFFDALYRGSTVGEAYLFSVPYLDWTVSLFGDPLLKIKFPAASIVRDELSIDTGWDLMTEYMCNAIAYGYRANNDLNQILSILAAYDDVQDKITLFTPFSNAFNNSDSSWLLQFRKPVTQLISFVLTNQNSQTTPFANYLTNRGLTVSGLFTLAANISLASKLLTPQGQWIAEFIMTSNPSGFATYHFNMNVSSDSAFGNIIYVINSEADQSGWSYEREVGIFVPIPANGVSYNFAGRRIRYTSSSDKYMPRGTVFYYQVQEKDDVGILSSYVSYQGIVST